MKIRTGFVSNSSTSSFIISYDKSGKELNIQTFLLRLLTDTTMSEHFRNTEEMIENIKSYKNDNVFYYIDGDYDETDVMFINGNIIFSSSNHYEWYDFLSKYYDFDYNEEMFYDNWVNNDGKLKNKIYVPIFGVVFDKIDYEICDRCGDYDKKYFINGKKYCNKCDFERMKNLNRIPKLKKILT